MNLATSYRMGRVQVVKHHVDFADVDPDRMKDLILAVHQRVLDAPLQHGLHFFNPEYSLTAPADTPVAEFIAQAERARTLWGKKLARFLGSGKAKKRLAKSLKQIERTLLIGGVLVLNGESYHPKAWPHVTPQAR